MATQAQILANRRNALHSTGPRSAAGKSVSRFNALRTGIQAKSLVIPGEDPAELEELAGGYHREFQPATPVERFLVDTIIDAEWQIRRLHQVEAKLWERALADSANTGEAYTRHLDSFTRLHRRLASVERSYYRALQQLQRLQIESAEPETISDLVLNEANSVPFQPPAPVLQPPPPAPVARPDNPALRL